jgi:dipeptidyl aminopeptidase/acylaminoacyl peptidase
MGAFMKTFALGSVVLLAVACGGGTPPPQNVDNPPPGADAAVAPPTSDAGTTAAKVEPALPAVDPTQLTDEQKARDAKLAPKAQAVVDAYSNVGGRLSSDKKKVFFRSNRDGVWHGWVSDVANPGAAPKKLTSGTERIASLQVAPDDKTLVYTSDQGADEDFRIYKMNVDGTGVTNLTPGAAMHRDTPFIPKLRPNVLVYSASDKKQPKGFVYLLPVAGGDEKLVYTDELPGGLEDVSPDGQRALFTRENSLSDQVLLEVDLDSGKAKRVYPPEGKVVRINSAAYGADGIRAFVATDDGQEAAYVVDINPTSRTIGGRYKEDVAPTGQIIGVESQPKGTLVAITVDSGDRTEVRLIDSAGMKLKTTVKAPAGVYFAGRWLDDGTSFVMNASTADQPNNISLVDAAGVVKSLRTEARPDLAKLPGLDVGTAKVDTFDAFKVPINSYLPKPRPAGKLPVIVNVHGGPAGSSKLGWNAFARFFAAQGFAFVEPNIRGSTGFGRAYEKADDREKRGDALKDLEAVNKWVKAQGWADPSKVIVMGGSYGGYMTLMALTRQPDLWRAGVDLVGIANLNTFLKSTAQQIRAVFVGEFGDLERDKDILEKWSPHKDFDKIKAPLFVYQGQNDPRVPRPEGDLIVKTLRDKKVPVEYQVAMNEGHSLDHRETKIEFLTRTARFLSDNLK